MKALWSWFFRTEVAEGFAPPWLALRYLPDLPTWLWAFAYPGAWGVCPLLCRDRRGPDLWRC